jgi:hypothetical protein
MNRDGSDTTVDPFSLHAPHCSTHITRAASSIPGIFLGYLVLSALVSTHEACISSPGRFKLRSQKVFFPGWIRLNG